MKELEFLLLESVIFEPENLYSFCCEARQPRSDIVSTAYSLFLKGYLCARIICCKGWRINSNGRRAYRRHRHLLKRSQNIIEVAVPSLEDIYKSLDGNLTLLYFLTQLGGQYLEKELSINWDLFYDRKNNNFSIPFEWWRSILKHKKIDHAERKNRYIIYSQNKATLESWIGCQTSTIFLESLEWDILKNKRILYWKQVPEIHIASFLYKSRDRTYPKDLAWYTVPKFESHPPSELLSEYFEYYYSGDLDTSEWKIEYIILKIGILYMEKYKSPRYLFWENYSGDMTQSKTLISGTSLFERKFIEANILDLEPQYKVNKETVAIKVFLNKIGVQSALDFQLMAKYSVTESGCNYCQFLEKTHEYLPEVGKFIN
jgi:hypothetical protein